ncbi:MAG TPA: DUF4097 family beta strand repeat protein [Clostridiales bacterium]|nr:DUF4097 family beta strand repeat protein [Clostridiales bacterium]
MRTFTKVWIGIALMALGFGIAVLGIAFVVGSRSETLAEASLQETYQAVESIDLQVGYGKVIIKHGEEFSINATHLVENSLESYVENGTWYIKEDPYVSRGILGLDISLGNIRRWNRMYNPEIIITVPEGFKAEAFDINVGAGDVRIDSIDAVQGKLSVDAGRLTADRIRMDKESEYRVGAGEMVLKDVELNGITLKCDVGHVKVEGILLGENDISCDVGRIELDLEGDVKDYSYDISSDIGNVTINGKSYHNEKKSIENEAGNSLLLDCSIGNITVDFQ